MDLVQKRVKIGQGYGPSALIPGSQKSPGSEKTPPRRQPENVGCPGQYTYKLDMLSGFMPHADFHARHSPSERRMLPPSEDKFWEYLNDEFRKKNFWFWNPPKSTFFGWFQNGTTDHAAPKRGPSRGGFRF